MPSGRHSRSRSGSRHYGSERHYSRDYSRSPRRRNRRRYGRDSRQRSRSPRPDTHRRYDRDGSCSPLPDTQRRDTHPHREGEDYHSSYGKSHGGQKSNNDPGQRGTHGYEWGYQRKPSTTASPAGSANGGGNNIGQITLVDRVVAYFTPGGTNNRVFEISRSKTSDPETNIVSKFHGVDNGWTGNIDNEASLFQIYSQLPSKDIKFILAPRLPRAGNVRSLRLNDSNENREMRRLILEPLMNMPPGRMSLVDGWIKVWMGGASTFEDLAKGYRVMVTEVASFVIVSV